MARVRHLQTYLERSIIWSTFTSLAQQAIYTKTVLVQELFACTNVTLC